MTARKRWPNEAEWARQDAVALALDIQAKCGRIHAALEQNNRLLAAMLASEIKADAAEIRAKLIEARQGR